MQRAQSASVPFMGMRTALWALHTSISIMYIYIYVSTRVYLRQYSVFASRVLLYVTCVRSIFSKLARNRRVLSRSFFKSVLCKAQWGYDFRTVNFFFFRGFVAHSPVLMHVVLRAHVYLKGGGSGGWMGKMLACVLCCTHMLSCALAHSHVLKTRLEFLCI